MVVDFHSYLLLAFECFPRLWHIGKMQHGLLINVFGFKQKRRVALTITNITRRGFFHLPCTLVKIWMPIHHVWTRCRNRCALYALQKVKVNILLVPLIIISRFGNHPIVPRCFFQMPNTIAVIVIYRKRIITFLMNVFCLHRDGQCHAIVAGSMVGTFCVVFGYAQTFVAKCLQ